MILVIILFFLIVAISFVLALQSMKNYQEVPTSETSLFLIRKSSATKQFLDEIWEELELSDETISLERLFKGQSSALVVFGGREPLTKYKELLDLLELEDYTMVNPDHISIIEIGVKDTGQLEDQSVFVNFPKLAENEQIFWQLILKAKKGKLTDKTFITQIRVAIFCPDQHNRQELSKNLLDLYPGNLIKIPRPYSRTQMLEFYKKRSLEARSLNLKLSQIVSLVMLRS